MANRCRARTSTPASGPKRRTSKPTRLPTDAAGARPVELPKTYYIVRLWASKKPFVAMWASWEQAELAGGKGVPAEYTFRLESAVTAGGRIVDEAGQADRRGQSRGQSGGRGEAGQQRRSCGLRRLAGQGTDAAVTDADGRWRIDNVPNHPQLELSLSVFHPDYVSDQHWRSSHEVRRPDHSHVPQRDGDADAETRRHRLRPGDRSRRQADQGRRRHSRGRSLFGSSGPANSRPTPTADSGCRRWPRSKRR